MDAERLRLPLFLEKSFLKPRKEILRGAELFNMGLLAELARLGIPSEVPIHPSWRKDFEELEAAGAIIRLMPFGSLFLNGLYAMRLVRRHEQRKIIIGNVANGLIPALGLMRLFKNRLQLVVFAHRMPSRRFIAVLPRQSARVLAVNNIIRDVFYSAGFKVETCFGHIASDRFHPVAKKTGRFVAGRPVNFCVIGFLDNAWKGADTALAAFRALPAEAARKSCLHLASYRFPPTFPEDNIRAYPWFPHAEMPDFLRRMDVMIVPSRDEGIMRETFSLAMVEGMLTGLPVLASNLPVLAEKLDAGGGFAFDDMKELSCLMAVLVMDPGKIAVLGECARQTALKRYVWNTPDFVKKYLT